ncbi:MAG TPA: hypothetical protein VFC19_00450 [Candidatus Limnocylindrales bacterium]|nr:hypothetical protein [Candidatus Limnocylindrales bacterium]
MATTLQLGVGIALGFRWQTNIWHLLAALGIALAFAYTCSWIMATIGLAIKNAGAIL